MLPTTVGLRLLKHEREAAMGNKGNPARVSEEITTGMLIFLV